jgi:cytidylate kinase
MADKKHIITLAGKLGSGKSTTAKLIVEELGFKHHSTGGLFREIAAAERMDVLQANLHAEVNSEADIDFQVDERQRIMGETEDNFVIDGRLAWYFIPNSFKVYLNLDARIGAERILADMDEERRQLEHVPEDPIEYAKLLDERRASESRRYLSLYGVDNHDPANFDLVIDTSHRTPEEVKDLIIENYNKWLAT